MHRKKLEGLAKAARELFKEREKLNLMYSHAEELRVKHSVDGEARQKAIAELVDKLCDKKFGEKEGAEAYKGNNTYKEFVRNYKVHPAISCYLDEGSILVLRYFH
jgi:hypothetical protein